MTTFTPVAAPVVWPDWYHPETPALPPPAFPSVPDPAYAAGCQLVRCADVACLARLFTPEVTR